MYRINLRNTQTCTVKLLQNYNGFERRLSIKSSKFKDENIGYAADKFELHEPGENFKLKNYIVTKHTTQLLKDHLQKTGGQVRTRFPPEPNGLLHIGHAKAININFGYAEAKNGICFLRYDDTNPEMEEEKFVQGIQEMIEWLGFQPCQITYASSYFQQLYELAEKLIEKDLAYVCHQPQGTDNSILSPWRNRLIKESLHEFKEMKNAKYKEGEATLRLKMMTEQRTIDPVAYRIKFARHYRTKNEWCIYPTYDYAHCLCDSIQNITHSLCTSEFSLRRYTYYWICNALEVYCPSQIEYGRLNFLFTVVSKRKISALVEAGVVKGWDDPRLYTLVALRRRGFPPEAINSFCRIFGMRTDNTYINPVHLHTHIRKYLENTATRLMAVIKPLKVIMINFPYDEPKQLEVCNVPGDPSSGSHSAIFDKEIWIEHTDFQECADEGFRRLTRDQGVGLKHASRVINIKEIVRCPSGEVDHLRVECIPLKEAKKPKAFIHWVAKPLEAEVRFYENLFKSERPDNLEMGPGGFMSDLNQNSLTTLTALVGNSTLNRFLPYQRFQFERIGYFSVDPESTEERVIFNRTLELKQNSGFSR